MKIKFTLLSLAVLLSVVAQAQWSNTSTNYTTGSLGIGTATPATPLHVLGGPIRVEHATEASVDFKTTALSPSQYFNVGANLNGFYVYEVASKSYLFNVNKNGNIGINTTAPQAKLHVNGGFIRVENANESVIQFKNNAVVPAQVWEVGASTAYGFYVYDGVTQTYKCTIDANGNFGIGVIHADSKLAVNGDIHAKEVRVDVLGSLAPDYVFENDYKLPSLTEVHAYIKQHKHLPEIPSASEMEEKGMQLKEMNMLLLKKVEELTLHAISQEEKIEALEKAMKALEAKVK